MCSITKRVFIVYFLGIFRGRTQICANPFLQENTRVEYKLVLCIFLLLAYTTLQRLGTLVASREVRHDNIQSTEYIFLTILLYQEKTYSFILLSIVIPLTRQKSGSHSFHSFNRNHFKVCLKEHKDSTMNSQVAKNSSL